MSNDKFWHLYYQRIIKNFERNAISAWETVKLLVVLSSSIISITLGANFLMQTSEWFLKQSIIMKSFLTGSTIILPGIMLIMLDTGKNNFTRECKRMYEHLSILIKIEEKYGMRGYRNKEHIKQFPEDKKYIVKRFDEIWKNSEQFRDKLTSTERDSFYYNMVKWFDV